MIGNHDQWPFPRNIIDALIGLHIQLESVGDFLKIVDFALIVGNSQPIRESYAVLTLVSSLTHEPLLAIALAALLTQPAEVEGRSVLVFATGGNVALEDFLRLLAA